MRRRMLSLGEARGNEPLVLAPAMDVPALRREFGWEVVDIREGTRCFDAVNYQTRVLGMSARLRDFVACTQLTRMHLSGLTDHALEQLVRQAIADGGMVVLRNGSGAKRETNPSVEQRKLVAEIERLARRLLTHEGRQYKLAAGGDLTGLARRDDFEVVRRDEARRVLAGLANQAGEGSSLLNLLRAASDNLTADWRPPFGSPDGLVLMRRARVRVGLAQGDDPLTPSQMKALIERETPELELDFDTDIDEDLELDFDTDVDEDLELECEASADGDVEPVVEDKERTSDDSDMDEGQGDDGEQPEEDDSDGDSEPEDTGDLASESDTEDSEAADDDDSGAVSDGDESVA